MRVKYLEKILSVVPVYSIEMVSAGVTFHYMVLVYQLNWRNKSNVLLSEWKSFVRATFPSEFSASSSHINGRLKH